MGYEIPRHWRLKRQRYSLVGEVCPNCDKPIFPPRDVCPNCRGETEITLPKGDIFEGKTLIFSAKGASRFSK